MTADLPDDDLTPPEGFPFASQAFGEGRLRQYRLVLLATPNVALMTIAKALMDLVHFCREEAIRRMWELHFDGRTPAIQTHLERGELYLEQLAEWGLNATLEPVA